MTSTGSHQQNHTDNTSRETPRVTVRTEFPDLRLPPVAHAMAAAMVGLFPPDVKKAQPQVAQDCDGGPGVRCWGSSHRTFFLFCEHSIFGFSFLKEASHQVTRATN